jgi:arylsulfatase A-like enzyme
LVAALDDNVGRLLDYLDRSGLSENTLVVYTSDNGFFLGDFGLFNKMWMYEESLRIPLLVRYPGHVKPGTVNDDFISILDIASTFSDYAQAKIPDQFQGASIRPILETGKAPDTWRKAHYYHYFGQNDVPPHYGVRTADYKLIHYYEEDSWELYDLKNDPHENHNQYNNPEKAVVVAKLKKELEDLRQEYESPHE